MLKRICPALLALGCCACSTLQTTAKLEAIDEDRITGEWIAVDDHGVADTRSRGTIKPLRDGYLIAGPAGDEEAENEPVFFTLSRVGQRLYVQWEGDGCAAFGDEIGECYMLGLVEVEDGEVRWYLPDPEWFAEESFSGRLTTPHKVVREAGPNRAVNDILITGSEQELRAMLEAYAPREEAFDLAGTLVRPEKVDPEATSPFQRGRVTVPAP